MDTIVAKSQRRKGLYKFTLTANRDLGKELNQSCILCYYLCMYSHVGEAVSH